MLSQKTSSQYTSVEALSIMAGWSPSQTCLNADDRWNIVSVALQAAGYPNPRHAPSHRSLEAEALEIEDIAERDAAARATFARQVRHG
jgi:hypothetical protein